MEGEMAELAISVTDVRYAYGPTVAVDGISFQVKPGEVLGFLGPNGAGKSTTIKMLTGMLPPQDGSVEVLGMDVRTHRREVQSQIGVCFEEKNLYIEMTATENLEFFARLFGIRHFDAKATLERVGLADRADDRVKRYSKGMRQRLMVARALVSSPAILFLDEPTDGLDPVSSRAIRTLIREEADRGAAVFLTTHDMHEADQLSDRVAFVNEGRIVAMDSPETLKLRHGTRSVRVRVRRDGTVDEKVIPLDQADAGDVVKQAMSDEGLLTIHTEEATLEDIFIQMTGRGLT
jgi:ABC-2 type transport system ATP-binding protein